MKSSNEALSGNTSINNEAQNKRILVVDDTTESRKLIAWMLKTMGYQIDEAENGPQALLRLANQRADLVLLDINMPGMDGTQVLKEIRKLHTPLQLPVIMATANDEQETIVQTLSLGANDYLVKPINRDIAAERIKTQLSLARLSQLQEDIVRFASHDLKKPMLVMHDIIDMALGLDLAAASNQAEMLELLQLLKSTSARMQDVVHGFMDKENYLVQANVEHQELNINEIITDVCQSDSSYAKKKSITLLTELAERLPSVSIPEFKVRQVLENFIGNAIKFCPARSTVRVRSKLDGQQLLVEVADTGPGLTEQDFQLLFQRNVKLSNKPTGEECSTGVGLPLCKELIESAGGRIGAYNNEATGVTFWFRIPVSL